MKARILKKLTVDGKEIASGTIVDVSGWKNARALEGSRYITFVSEEETKKEIKSKETKESLTD